MTKPIEWTTTENMPVIFWHRMHVDESGELRDATPSDLVAALAAMGEGERAEVLAAFHGDSIVHRHLQERVEDAERERDRMAREFGTRPGELPDDGEIARVVRERAEFRARAEKAERERDEARRDKVTLAGELHDARVEVGSLRTRLIAAETTAAQREPREYPLAPNSEWSGDAIVDGRGTIQEYEGGYVTVRAHVGSAEARITLIAANLAALLHRAGVV